MSNTVGQDTVVYLENGIKSRYFYGLRRTDEGTLYIGKVDQLQANDPVTINVPGAIVDNYEGFDQGEDFYEVEITLEELSHYLFDSLELPDLEKKKLITI